MKRFLLPLLVMATPALARDNGLELWEKIHEVFSHPRCANCHVGPDNVPVWSGPNVGDESRAHGMKINGGESRIGAEYIACNTCHMQHNSVVPHGPPGAHVWALAPVEMQWYDKTSTEICAQIKDPARNGGRTIADVAEHINHDGLVHWGWAPGPGREPAPYTVEELVRYIRQWDGVGAPCPSE